MPMDERIRVLLSGSTLRGHKEALLLPESVCVAFSSAGSGGTLGILRPLAVLST